MTNQLTLFKVEPRADWKVSDRNPCVVPPTAPELLPVHLMWEAGNLRMTRFWVSQVLEAMKFLKGAMTCCAYRVMTTLVWINENWYDMFKYHD